MNPITAKSLPKIGNNGSPSLAKFSWGLLILLFILVAAAAYYFVFAPQIRKFRSGGELDTRLARQNFDKAVSYFSQLRKARESVSRLKSDPNLEKLQVALPDSLDVSGLLVQLEALAVENGLLVRSVEVVEAPEAAPGQAAAAASAQASGIQGPGAVTPAALTGALPPKVKKVNVLMQVGKGDYSSFKSFLQAVESNLRLLDLVSFNFDPKSDRQTLNLVTYYYKE